MKGRKFIFLLGGVRRRHPFFANSVSAIEATAGAAVVT
jgi:hypothetical protein